MPHTVPEGVDSNMLTPPSPQRPTLVQRAPRSGAGYWQHRLDRVRRNVTDAPWRALGIAVSNAVGVAISIAIIAASDGIDKKIRSLLPDSNAASMSASGIDISTIHSVLTQTKDVLTVLAVVFTAAVVGLVTWISTSQRRRNISLEVQSGQHKRDLITELVSESFLLCVSGGALGIVIGLILCGLISVGVPLLPMQPSAAGVVEIFPATTLLAFLVTAAIAAYFASHTDTRVTI